VISIWRWVASSLTVKLVLLVGIFIALPLLLYGQFEGADRTMRDLVSGGVQRQNWLIAQALKPKLDQPEALPSGLSEELDKYTGDNTVLKLMLRPAGVQAAGRFYFVAAAPSVGTARINAELDSLEHQGILQELMPSCTWKTSAQVRSAVPGSAEEVLTSVIPVDSRWGCWVLVVSHSASEFFNTSIGQPYWQEPEIRYALFVYIGLALLVAFTAWSVWRNLHRFRRVANTLRAGRNPDSTFLAQNDIPELANVAAMFDRLVSDLHGVARDIRRTAEDNAHSFKTPIATIEASLGPLRRGVAAEDGRASRSLALIDSSLDRLKALISAAQQLDNLSADLIEAPRNRINMGELVSAALLRYREVATSRGIRLRAQLDANAHILASHDAVQVVVENVLDNAISFSPANGAIDVSLTRTARTVELRVTDEGPGIDTDKIERIFERYFSLRPRNVANDDEDAAAGGTHAGLGLWIVRRHVQSLGGAVTATNRAGGGTSIAIDLPAAG